MPSRRSAAFGATAGLAALLLAVSATLSDPVDAVAKRLMLEEGFRATPYTDSRGVETIGFGTAIGKGITRSEGELLLRERLGAKWTELGNAAAWVKTLPDSQQEALLDLAYQLGTHGVLEFTDMLAALRKGDCTAAQAAGRDSAWARETPQRAEEVLARMCQ